MMTLRVVLAFVLSSTLFAHAQPKQPPHVVLVVWDGMRSDFVTREHCPVLWQLIQEGVRFEKHHATYPTSTQVNGVAIATGVYPARSGLLANREFRPALRAEGPFDSADESIVRRGDELTGGKYLALPTLAERVRANGGSVAIAGSKSVVLLGDRTAEWMHARHIKHNGTAITIMAASPMSAALKEQTERLLGPPLAGDETIKWKAPTLIQRLRRRIFGRREPGPQSYTDTERNTYTTRVLTEILWRERVPTFSWLWLSEPDLSCHAHAPGSPEALAAIKSSDDNLGRILKALEEKGVRDSTDIFVVSDHGFSTITRAVNVPVLLREAGFDAPDRFVEPPRRGQVMVVGNGGSSLFYVIERDPEVTERLVEWLQRSDFAGAIFTREQIEGAFPLQTVGLWHEHGPDVVLAMNWADGQNRYGVRGEIAADVARGVGLGTHASLSPFDVQSLLVAAGPSFRKGATIDLPSANIDIAPTILSLLQIPVAEKLDGRLLEEAFLNGSAPLAATQEVLKSSRDFSDGKRWQQELHTSRVGDTIYLDFAQRIQ